MSIVAILTFLFATMGVVFVGISAEQMTQNQSFKDGFINAVDKFLELVRDTVEYQTKYKHTYALITEYAELGQDILSLRKWIVKQVLTINAGTAVIIIQVWNVIREMCNAIAEKIINFSISSDTPVSNAKEIAEINGFTNFDESLDTASLSTAVLECIAYLMGQGVKFVAINGEPTELASTENKPTRTYYSSVLGMRFFYQIGSTPTTNTFTSSKGITVTYYEPVNPEEDLTVQFADNPSSTAVMTGVTYILNASGENISNQIGVITIHATADGEYETGGATTDRSIANYYGYRNLLGTSGSSTGYSVSKFFSTVSGSYVQDYVKSYVGTYYTLTQTIFNNVISGGKLDSKVLSEVYNKVVGVEDGAIGDILTPSRIESKGEIYGNPVITIPSDWVETYPSIGSLDLSLAGSLANVDVYPWVKSDSIVIPNENVGVVDDVLSATDTAEDVLEKIDSNPSPITPPIIQNPIIGVSSSGFITLFNPTMSELSALNDVLWSEDFITNFRKLITDPMDGIISLLAVPIQPNTSGKSEVTFGNFKSGISMRRISNQYGSFSCGSIEVKETFGNYMDYAPYTKIVLYLPFIGFITLNTNEVMSSVLGVVYNIDFLTGECIAQVTISKTGLSATAYVYNGNMGMQLPITGSNYSRFYSGIIKGAVGVASGIASGSVAAPLAVGSILNLAMNSGGDVIHSGSISGNAGFLGEFRPYLIVTLPVPNMADNYNVIEGYVSNDNLTIGSRSGFVRVKEVHLAIPNATAEEVQEIESLLKTGIEV